MWFFLLIIKIALHNFTLHSHFYSICDGAKQELPIGSILYPFPSLHLSCWVVIIYKYLLPTWDHQALAKQEHLLYIFPKAVYSNCHTADLHQFHWLNGRSTFYLISDILHGKHIWTIYTFHICVFFYLRSLKNMRTQWLLWEIFLYKNKDIWNLSLKRSWQTL